jgi:hypothetical protein
MQRSAPEGGYVGGTKAQYRRNVWATFRDAARRQMWPISECDVLLMPSSEGKEIEVAEAAGFHRRRLHVVDSNAAIVASLTKRFPGINTYGVTAGRAAERIAKAGVRLRFANLDFCGPVSRSLSHELAQFAQSGCLAGTACVAVTELRGRERKPAQSYLQEACGEDPRDHLKESWKAVFARLSVLDVKRALFVGCHLAYRHDRAMATSFPLRCETYRSTAGNQTMLWSAWQVVEPPPAYWLINANLERDLSALAAGVNQ